MSEDCAHQEWSTSSEDYKLEGVVGKGAFATVYRASTTKGGICAIKVLNLDHIDSNLGEIRLEVQSMRLSSHPNVLTCFTAFVTDVNLWLVTPLMSKGSSLHCLQSARRRIREDNSRSVPQMEQHIMYVMHETLLGLQYIHENGQIHRDIKAGNILLDGNGDVRIADFGVSGWLVQGGSQQEKAQTFVGTPCWMAPEVMEQVHGYDYKADIWSLGITMLELARGYAPYAKFPPMKVLILTIQDDPPSLDSYTDDDDEDLTCEEEYSKAFRSLVQLCLQKNPTRRPACQDLLQSKSLSHLNDSDMRETRRHEIKSEICDLVADVGAASNASSGDKKLPGTAPVSFIIPDEKDRPKGTTWIFEDGSQVLSSTATKAQSVDEVMEELEVLSKNMGGEDYDRTLSRKNDRRPKAEASEDGIQEFMDNFESTTGGENFRRI